MEPNLNFTILCISSFEKGADFMRQCKRDGCRVILLTSESLQNADWPRESIDQIYYITDENNEWIMKNVINSVSYLAREEDFNKVVALDDYDVEKAASIREHLRIPGMGETIVRYFRDKLAMRARAKEVGILVPDFVHVLNYKKIKEFISEVAPPYMLKPRMEAGAIGIKRVHSPEELWKLLDELGENQSFYLLEKFVEGNIFHVDSIVFNKEVKFALASEYGTPPMEVAHEGRVFTTNTMRKDSDEEKLLFHLNKQVLSAMGMVQGVSHTEFIRSKSDDSFYFLETSARVGGAHIAELVEAASGINLWTEWAKIETLPKDKDYVLPETRSDYAGLLLSLAKQEWPDMSAYDESEIVWRIKKKYHAGLIVRSAQYEKVKDLLSKYTARFYEDFFISQPLGDKPS